MRNQNIGQNENHKTGPLKGTKLGPLKNSTKEKQFF